MQVTCVEMLMCMVLSASGACGTSDVLSTQQGTGTKKTQLAGDDSMRAGRAETTLTWNSPELLVVKREWEALADSFPRPWTRDGFSDRVTKLSNVLKNRFSSAQLRELAKDCDVLPVEAKDWGEFARALIAEMIITFLKAGDRESLVTLLSTRCPREVYLHTEIEYYIVREGQKLSDPILILAEAYAKSRVPQARRELAAAVRRGFDKLGIVGKEDDAFVKNAMDFYKQNKDQLYFNSDYYMNAAVNILPPGYEHNSLFKKRDKKGSGCVGDKPE
jgi:hypothetical protein